MKLSSFIITQPEKQQKLIGNKAVRLAILKKNGYNVPNFFVISKNAYKAKRYIIKKKLQFIKLLDHQKINLANENESDIFFAIRSSAPFEDGLHSSLAGQLKTYLNIKSSQDLWNSIKDIWESIEAPHLKMYLSKFSIKPKMMSTAIVIQKMIKSEISGVLFTHHPVLADKNQIYVEIVEGMCERLVSGKARPVQIVINKDNFTFEIISQDTIPDSIDKFLKKHDIINELVQSTCNIEKLFGYPQDIEWVYDGNLWIIQCRPISNLPENERIIKDNDGKLWTDYFFSERFVECVSPLGWSLLKPLISKNAFRESLWYLGYNNYAKKCDLTKLFASKPYTDLDVFKKLYSIIPPKLISEDKKKALRLYEYERKWYEELVRVIPFLISRLITKELAWIPFFNLYAWKNFERQSQKKCDQLSEKLQKGVLENAQEIFRETEILSDRFLSIHRWSITFADVFISLLQKFLNILFKNEQKISAIDLISGLSNKTVLANLKLARLSPDSKNSFNQFIEQFGHRSESLDIAAPVWADRTDSLKTLLTKNRGNLHIFEEKIRQSIRRRENIEKHCKRKILQLNILFRYFVLFIFQQVLFYSRQFALLRENQRDTWHKILYISRKSALVIGGHLSAKGKFVQDDIFFLKREELMKVQNYSSNNDINKKISARKKTYNSHKKGQQQSDLVSTHSKHALNILKGIGVSRGTVEGRARITRSYNDAFLGEKGEILVVPSADPAWSPIFNIISGLIMETGGVLSHASIIAREFHLPTVTSIDKATRLIKNGDRIKLDGELGIVEILEKYRENIAEDVRN